MRRPCLTYYPIIALLALAFLQSCTQHASKSTLGEKQPPQTTDTQINKIIAQAKKVENSDIKLLMPLSAHLSQISRQSGNERALVYSKILKATYYWQSANHSQAMETALQALEIAEKWKVNVALPQIHRIIANLHKENGDYADANKEADNGLNIARLNHDTTALIEMLGLKAMFTHSYYLMLKRPQDDLTSLGLQFEGLKIAESSPEYERLRIRFYNNIAQAYKDQKAYDKTLYYTNKAILVANKYNQLRSLTYSYCWLGQAYYFMGQHKKGLQYLTQSLDISRKIKEPYRQMEIYQSIYDCYLSTQNYKEALTCANRVSSLRDSIQLAKSVQQISDMQLRYEADKKDQQITLLNQSGKSKNLAILLVLVSLVIFLILCIILMYQYLTIKRKNKAIRNKNHILNEALLKIAHIQSHEVRKPLASILGLMNVFKIQNYEVGKDELLMVETSTKELDEKIRGIILATESKAANPVSKN